MIAHRERRLLLTIVRLMGDATDSDPQEVRLRALVDEAAALFDAEAAGLLLVQPSGALQVAAATDHRSGILEKVQVDTGEGPGVEAALTGDEVAVLDVKQVQDRWPHFGRSAADAGYVSALSIPLRLHAHVLGSLDLFRTHAGALDPVDVAAARALADIATIGIVRQRALDDQKTRTTSLPTAPRNQGALE